MRQISTKKNDIIEYKYSSIISKSVSVANNAVGTLYFDIPSGGTKIVGFIPLSCEVSSEIWRLDQKINDVSISNTRVTVSVYQYNGNTYAIKVQGIIIYI